MLQVQRVEEGCRPCEGESGDARPSLWWGLGKDVGWVSGADRMSG